ncbi:MAG: peptide deformylase [Turicibacter sp.]|nr:peptide deformylase [Turicibacter sp.]
MITMKDIIREGHPTLTMKAKEVPVPLSNEHVQLMKDMLQYIKNSQDERLAEKYDLRESVGLAAPQLNILERIIAVHSEDEKGKIHSYALANPKVISHSEEMTYLPTGEGCLSIDREVEGLVPRHRRLTIEGYDMDSKKVRLRLRGYIGVVFQHEIDHLNGVLFIDRIDAKNPMAPIPGAKAIEFEE